MDDSLAKLFYEMWMESPCHIRTFKIYRIIYQDHRYSRIYSFVVSESSHRLYCEASAFIFKINRGESQYQFVHLVYMNNRLTRNFKMNWMNDYSLNGQKVAISVLDRNVIHCQIKVCVQCTKLVIFYWSVRWAIGFRYSTFIILCHSWKQYRNTNV